MTEFFVKVTEGFDPADPKGAIVACPNLYAGLYFSEHAWDDGQIDGMRIIRIRPCPKRSANYEVLLDVLEELGIDLNSGFPEDVLPGLVCLRQDVRDAIEARGFDSVDIQSGIVVTNWETGAKLLWRPETFEIVPEPEGVPGLSVERSEENLVFGIATSAGALAVLRTLDAAGDFGWKSLSGLFREALSGTGLVLIESSGDDPLTIVDPDGSESWILTRSDYWTPGALILYGDGVFFDAMGPAALPTPKG